MCQQQFEAEVMDEQKMQDLLKDKTVQNLIKAYRAGYEKGLEVATESIDKAYELLGESDE